jgi:hypothetical protein
MKQARLNSGRSFLTVNGLPDQPNQGSPTNEKTHKLP